MKSSAYYVQMKMKILADFQICISVPLKPFRSCVKGKHSVGRKIPESSCARKESVDIDMFVASRNGDRKIMQSIRIMSRPSFQIRKWNQLSQFR